MAFFKKSATAPEQKPAAASNVLKHDKPMRVMSRELSKKDAEEILAKSSCGVIATQTQDGWPYGVTVNHVYKDGKIYFHHTNAADSLLNSCLSDGANVCFTVVSRTQVVPEAFTDRFESAVAFGTVRKCADQRKGFEMICERFSPGCESVYEDHISSGLKGACVWEIEIDHLTAKANRPKN